MRKRKDTRAFWAADCETDPFKNKRIPKPFVWGLYTGTSFYSFKTAQEFVDFIKDQDVIIYFHNGGKFDMHFLLWAINLGVEIQVINGRLVVAHIGKAELRDSWNILPTRLANLGGKLDIDINKLEANVRDKHMPEIMAYLTMDCVSLWEAIDKMEREYGRHLTIASASLHHWKKISGLAAPKSDKAFFDEFVKYYYGGRVQAFKKGHTKGPLKYFDIRSAYAWAMLDEHPYEPEYIRTVNPKSILPSSMVTLSAISNGALPFRDDRGSILFPDDDVSRTYFVPGHEVLAAQETGSLRNARIIECVDFTMRQTFAPYINYHYNRRKDFRSKDMIAETEIEKMFLTNLYGKFCANPENYGNYMCVPFGDMQNYLEDGYVFDGLIGPHALLKAPLEFYQENYLNVATGASITSMVRAHLWRAIDSAKGVVYCDTDSLICEDAELPIGEDLGHWNLEGIADDCWVAGKKMYYMSGKFEKGKTEKSASKGVNFKLSQIKDLATGRKIMGDEAIKLAAQGGEVLFEPDAPTFMLKDAGQNAEQGLETRVRFTPRRVRMT